MEDPLFLTSYQRTKNQPRNYSLNRLPIQTRREYQMDREFLQTELRKNLDLIQRLAISDTLTSHTGCVNTLDWNNDGRHLLSGSDDHHLIIWDTAQYGAAEPFKIKTEHQGNIFSAKFLHERNVFVSASGDGLVIRAQLAEGLVQQRAFRCHTGATYKVLPLLDDPSSFISCSEDSTVRLFDIRQEYAQCGERPGCPHSLLVNMEKAVSSMALNPARPYEMAIGCSDSTISIYDRRKVEKPLNRIRLQTIKNMPRRITSLQYDRTGTHLLANVLAEKIQLIDLSVGKQLRQGTAKKIQDAKELLPSDPMPIKRLRLRGDWSDTGPQSRPGQRPPPAAAATPTSSSRFMVEISDLMTTWMRDQMTVSQPPPTPPALSGTSPAVPTATRTPLVATTDRSGDGGRNDSGIEDLLASTHAASASQKPPENMVSLKPVMQYAGHRSSRTMIKEACFWDDEYIISGSDCGRIFLWQRETGRLVNVKEGDAHVVNCVRPHPFDFVLATSGIDYDVKLWRPVLEEAEFDEEAAESIVDVNNQMLEETRDTVTVPALAVVQILRQMARRNQEAAQPAASAAENVADNSDSEAEP